MFFSARGLFSLILLSCGVSSTLLDSKRLVQLYWKRPGWENGKRYRSIEALEYYSSYSKHRQHSDRTLLDAHKRSSTGALEFSIKSTVTVLQYCTCMGKGCKDRVYSVEYYCTVQRVHTYSSGVLYCCTSTQYSSTEQYCRVTTEKKQSSLNAGVQSYKYWITEYEYCTRVRVLSTQYCTTEYWFLVQVVLYSMYSSTRVRVDCNVVVVRTTYSSKQ
jgi:hypothetical protein